MFPADYSQGEKDTPKVKVNMIITLNSNNKIYGLDDRGGLWVLEPDSVPLTWKFLLDSPEAP